MSTPDTTALLAEARALLNEALREQPLDIAMRRHIFNHLEKPAPQAAAAGQRPLCLTHPTIHVDYYKWLGEVKNKAFESGFIKEHAPDFRHFHAIAMWVWTESRDTAARSLATTEAGQQMDSERLQWLLDYITAKGTNGLGELVWSLYDEDGKSLNEEKSVTEDEVSEIRFDRPTIDRARAAASPAKGGAE